MDEQLYLMAVGLSLDEKVTKAIANLQHYEHEALKRDPENGYYLCDSYGKDSGVILDLAKRSGVKFKAHHNLTTLDPPELVRFGRKNHPETVVHKPKMPMLKRLSTSVQGPPTRLSRWCCAEYKEQSGNDFIKVFGVRAAESARRAVRWKVWTAERKREQTWILNPILYWTDEDVWRYTNDQQLAYCGLYDEGFKRLGCVGCPMSNRNAAFERWPKYKAAWKRAVDAFFSKYKNVPRKDGGERWMERMNITSSDQLWDWWMEENQPDKDDGCQMGLF